MHRRRENTGYAYASADSLAASVAANVESRLRPWLYCVWWNVKPYSIKPDCIPCIWSHGV